MGEEFPLNPEQVQPLEEQQGEQLPQPNDQAGVGSESPGTEVQTGALVEPSTAQSENVDPQPEQTDEPVHLATINHDDKKWDVKKAETLAPIVHEEFEPELEEVGYRQAQREKDKIDPDFEDEETKEAHKTWDLWERHDPYNYGGNISRDIERNSVNQMRYNTEKHEQTDRIDGKVKEAITEVDRNLNGVISPFEELYDTNPNKFANMPTHEFVEIGREYRDISDAYKFKLALKTEMGSGWRFGTDEHYQDVAEAIEKREPVSFKAMMSLARHYSEGLSITEHPEDEQDDSTFLSMVQEIGSVMDGSAEKTKSEMMDEFMKIAEGWKNQFDDQVENAAWRAEDFLDKHRSEAQKQKEAHDEDSERELYEEQIDNLKNENFGKE
jgi:hypothetical protein